LALKPRLLVTWEFLVKFSAHGFLARLCRPPKIRFNCLNGSRQKKQKQPNKKATQGVFYHALGA